jgi:hypothetical protein
MATELLRTGVSNALTQNVVYALPAVAVFLQSTVAVELAVDGSTFVLNTATTTGIQTAALAVRCTTAASICTIKRF